MRIKVFKIVGIVALAMVAGCTKDDGMQLVKLYADGFEPDANAQKAAVDGKYTYWISGDDVRINQNVYSVSVPSSTDEAAAAHVLVDPTNTYKAVYPSSIYESDNNTNYTVKVPWQYFYHENGGKQVLNGLPMAAYYSGTVNPTELSFRHLTAALTVRVKNEKSHALDIDRIVLVNDQYQLSGNYTFDISNFSATGTPVIAPHKTGHADSVVIHFVEYPKRIASGQYIDVQVPILPVGTDNSTFTIKVFCHLQGSRFIFTRSTPSRNNSIGRSCLGYAVAKYNADQPADDLFDTQTGEDGRNYYEIGSVDELRNLSTAMDSMWTTSDGQGQYIHANYVVTNDIDMQGEVLTPIHYYNLGGESRCYFDGQGHTISNFVASSVDENEPNCCGLFGKSSGDSITIKNLNIDNAQYDFAHVKQKIIDFDQNPCSAVGGIYAVVDHKGIVIENCTVQNIRMGATDNVMSGEQQTDFYASGIVGLCQTDLIIRNCFVGNVTIDNSNDASSKALVDQFGPAIGRIDVGNTNGSNTYGQIGSRSPVVLIENFTYIQGENPLVFEHDLKNIRYGGIVANITRGGQLVLKNCRTIHNVVVHKPSTAMYLGGIIGSNKCTSKNMALYLGSDCVVGGTIDNQATATFNNSYQVEKYVAGGQTPTTNHIVLLSGSSSTCTNTLTMTGLRTTFYTNNQHF